MLLTNGIVRMLEEDPRFMVLGCASSVDEALVIMNKQVADAIIVLGTDDQTTLRVCPVLAKYPDVPVLRVDISKDHVELVTSKRIEATPGELLEAVATLPSRTV
jgi:DNA-binding NarL/FixJ family response regulator